MDYGCGEDKGYAVILGRLSDVRYPASDTVGSISFTWVTDTQHIVNLLRSTDYVVALDLHTANKMTSINEAQPEGGKKKNDC